MADPIPGVSGGTIAYITGLYDQVIDRVSRFRSHPDGWLENLRFLIPIVVGIFLGIFLFAHLIDWLLNHFPNLTLQGFVGLVIGGLLVMSAQGKLIMKGRGGVVSMTVAGVVAIGFALVPRPELSEPIRDPSVLQAFYLVGAGAASAATMLLPGVSGSMLQLLLGTYSTYISAVKEINTLVLGLFLVGAVAGIISMARIISYLFRNHFVLTQALIGGLVIGSIVVIWPWQLDNIAQVKGIGVAAICALLPWYIHRLQMNAQLKKLQ